MKAKGIVLEMFRLRETLETTSDFYIITNPFDTEIHPVSKEEALEFIRNNQLHVAVRDNSGRIYDTATCKFQREWAASEKFKKIEPESDEQTKRRLAEKAMYKETLFDLLDKVWDGEEEIEEDED